MENKSDSLLIDVGQTLTSEPIVFKVQIVNPSIREKVLIKLKRMKPYREFKVKPLVYGKLIQISTELLKMNLSALETENLQRACYNILRDFHSNYAHILAIALTPGKRPSESIKEFLIDNTTPEEILHLCNIIVQKMDLQNFLRTIGCFQNFRVMQAPSPMNQEELKKETSTIAPGTLSEV
jgi:hypothetical protein